MRSTLTRKAALPAIALGLLLSACSSGTTPESATLTSGDGSQNSVVAIGAGDIFFAQGDAKSSETDLTFTAKAGSITIQLDNAGATQHDVTVEEITSNTMVADAAPGTVAEGTIELVAGTYTLYCNIPGHRAAGMEATLVVS